MRVPTRKRKPKKPEQTCQNEKTRDERALFFPRNPQSDVSLYKRVYPILEAFFDFFSKESLKPIVALRTV